MEYKAKRTNKLQFIYGVITFDIRYIRIHVRMQRKIKFKTNNQTKLLCIALIFFYHIISGGYIQFNPKLLINRKNL